MSKLDQIQRELQQINEAKFQELCDALLHKSGHEAIHPVGSAVGKEKTVSGTPDTFILLPNGKYVFVEYTTQSRGLLGKLLEDLEKCLDETKTGVPVSKIEKVILGFNSTLSPKDVEKLAEKCQAKGCDLEIYDIGRISFTLSLKYPTIAKKFLGIEVDTGQVLDIPDFIESYQKKRFATPLDTRFHFREEETEAALKILGEDDLLVIAGKAGTGKSRLALECCARFRQGQPEYQVYAIHNKDLPLYEDLRSYLLPNRDYIVLVDDANRLSQLDQILRLTENQNKGNRIKIIITVRDYALPKIKESIKPYFVNKEIVLRTLEKDQLIKIISEEFGIKNPDYQDRIWRISKGNLRLAVMSSMIALETNRLSGIDDVSNLYDEYFASITRDLDQINDPAVLKAAGMVSFFRVLRRENNELYTQIEQAFGISKDQLWDAITRLHDLEIIDLYEDEVVKNTDQILGAYLFYKVFIKDQLLDLSTLLDKFFDRQEHKFKEAIYPVCEAFDKNFVNNRLQKHITHAWHEAKTDERRLLRLIDVFWFLKETEALVLLAEAVNYIPPACISLATVSLEPPRDQRVTDSYLNALLLFQHSTLDNFEAALELICTYIEKRPDLLPQAVHIFSNMLCFNRHSHRHAYLQQRTIVEVLIQKSREGANQELYTRLLIKIAGTYLQTQFQSYESEEKLKVTIYTFQLKPCGVISAIRQSLWGFLFNAYQHHDYLKLVLETISRYSYGDYNNPVKEIVERDAESVIPFLKHELNPASYRDCVIVQHYIAFLKRKGIAADLELEARFATPIYKLSTLLLLDFEKRREMGYEQYQQHWSEELSRYFAAFTLEDYAEFFNGCLIILSHHVGDRHIYQLYESITIALCYLSESDPVLFKQVVQQLLNTGNLINYQDGRVVTQLFAVHLDARAVYDLLREENYNLRETWLFSFFSLLSKEQVDEYFLAELYKLYQQADINQINCRFDYLESYERIDRQVISNVTSILFDRCSQSGVQFDFSLLFNPHATVCPRLKVVFAHNPRLLKSVYFYQENIDRHHDYSGEGFSALMGIDPHFIEDYLTRQFDDHALSSYWNDTRHYEFLWKRDDYEMVMMRILDLVFRKEESRAMFRGNYLSVFFVNHNNDPLIDERVDTFLTKIIAERSSDHDLMIYVFSLIANNLSNKRKQYLELFLDNNENPELFKQIPLEPYMDDVSVEVYEGYIKFFESLLPLVSKPKFLKHRLHVEQTILRWRQEIAYLNKRLFTEEW